MKRFIKANKKALSLVLAIILCAACFSFYGVTTVSATDVELTFNSSSAMAAFNASNSLTVAYSEGERSVMMAATGGGDPYVLLNVEGLSAISADTYKYVVVTYRTPTTNSGTASQTELFMCAGSITQPTANYSVRFAPTNGYKYRSEIIDMTGAAYWTGQVHSIRFDVFMNASAWDAFYLASVTFCPDSASASAAATAKASEANGDLDIYTEAQLASNTYNLDLYTKRYWKGNIVFNETVYPLCNADGSISPDSLMFDIKRVVSVRSGNLQTEYKYGVDYTITADGKFQILTTGNIPRVAYNNFYFSTQPANNNPPTQQRKNGGYVYYSESAFHSAQIAITYTHDDPWDGYVPDSKIDLLPKTYTKLQNQQALKVVFYGDSITVGCNASSFSSVNTTPYTPIWADMTIAGLKAKYGYNNITHVNTAVGGMASDWGLSNVQANVVNQNPDLVFIGFGMNDGTLQVAPATFKANIKGIIDAERAANANSEFILVATMLANPDTLFDGYQSQYLAVLEELESQYSGVAVANMTSTHDDLLDIKSYQDMTGNNVNHPNDFMVRYYAQTMLTLLSPSALAEDKADAIRVLNAYKNPADYRPAEQAEIQSIIAAGTANINAATSTAEVRTALNAAKAQLDALKTAAEYEAENLDYTNLNFGSAATLTTISRYNHVSSSLNSGSGVTNFASTGDDPYFRINYDPGNVSADTYKYIVIVYNVPSGVTNTSITQVFFQSGSNTSDAEARSITFTTEKGHYAYKLIDLSAASYWTGKIHSIRIDPFQNYVAGDSISIKSVRLFETSAEAATYGGRTVGILSGSYIGINESIQFDTPSEITRITSTGGTRYRGDVDENGVVTSQDYNKLKRFMACYVIEGFNEFLADANADGIISIKDCLKIKKDLANLTSPLTVEGASSTATYSSTYKCAQLDATSAPGTVLIDVSDKHLSADDFQNIALVYQNRSGGSYTVTASLMRNGSEIANSALTFTAQATQQYVSTPLDFSSVAGWSGDIDTIKLTFNGTSMHLGGIIISDSSTAVASKGNTKAQSLNRMCGSYTPVTGQTVVSLDGTTTTMATFSNYSSASNGSYTCSKTNGMSFTLDRQPDEKFDRLSISYTANCSARGIITYNVAGASMSDEVFLEGSLTENTFHTIIPGYFSGSTSAEIISITIYPARANNCTFTLTGISTEDMANYSGEIYLQNTHVKVGVLLTMGGGLSYYEKPDDNNASYGNLLNRYDVGRLIQQSYYGINQSPYVMGDMGGTPWGYNPVQGGDVHNNASQIVDLQVDGNNSIYVKCRPMDWGHNGHLTPSYMENWYTLYDNFVKVDNRFVDYSNYNHTARTQELPAFYTVSALGTFCMYTGNQPWTGAAYTARSNLDFWGYQPAHNLQTYTASSEGWYAWIDGTGFGIGLYVPNVTEVLAGRFGAPAVCYSPDENPTNYFAPHRTMTLKQEKPLTYSYLIAAGMINDFRNTFRDNRGLINNSALSSY